MQWENAWTNHERACPAVPDNGPLRPCSVIRRGPTTYHKGLKHPERVNIPIWAAKWECWDKCTTILEDKLTSLSLEKGGAGRDKYNRLRRKRWPSPSSCFRQWHKGPYDFFVVRLELDKLTTIPNDMSLNYTWLNVFEIQDLQQSSIHRNWCIHPETKKCNA